MKLVMGIDGGGSGVRAVITTPGLEILGSGEAGSANPNSAGREAAAHAIHTAVLAALDAAQLPPDAVEAVGAGIAGTVTAPDWVRATLAAVLPRAVLHVASDVEIALVGAHGERRGILILAGTGSVAYGINEAGETAQVGGWGYLLGDEGSGYQLGLLAPQAVVRAADGRAQPTVLTEAILSELHLSTPKDLIPWVYAPSRTRDIAGLARLVLAASDDAVAQGIIAQSVAELALGGQTVAHRLEMKTPAFAFAGGLLSALNPLSAGLVSALGLPALPVPKYPPVLGAALLALLSR